MKRLLFVAITLAFFMSSCEEDVYIPKPTGYARIDFPEHAYQWSDKSTCPYYFQYGSLAKIVPVDSSLGEQCWLNVEYPQQNAKIHFTYYDLHEHEVASLIEDTRILAMKHLVKADDFEESVIKDAQAEVYGVMYDFQGSTASNFQFYLTDSVSHFVRGALYFEVVPHADSLAPAEKYIEEELNHLIHSFRWIKE